MAELGYRSSTYGASFREFGEVITLPGSGIQVIKRPIADDHFDLAGLYPFTSCSDWSRLDTDLDFARAMGAVSLVLVVDPFAERAARKLLSRWNVCRPFKTHFIVNLTEQWQALIAKNVRNSIRQSLRRQVVEVVDDAAEYADLFWNLYQNTIQRHAVSGIQRFSRKAIATQLQVDGSMLLIARIGDSVHGALLSYAHGETGHLHLVGHTTHGYAIKTSYALIYGSLEALGGRGCTQVNLGGASGLSDDDGDGLYQFKRRWTQHRGISLLCGKILDSAAYSSLARQLASQHVTFFPAYRTPGGKFEWRPGLSAPASSTPC